MPDDIPNLTLRGLEKIQAELVALNTRVDGLREDVQTLNERFDDFLAFVGRDVQDLKTRVLGIEQQLAAGRTS